MSTIRLAERGRAGIVLLAVWLLGLTGCHTTPVSGRRQVNLIPEQQEIYLGMQAFEEILAEEPLSQNARYNEMVTRVGRRIAKESGRDDFAWEFRVFASHQMNAFCLPGGKVGIYEGIMPICENEAGLAVVMAHEVAHAIARHGGERLTQQGLVHGAGRVIDIASQDRDQRQRERILSVFGAASQYGFILPYSRKHESEADQIGLVLMARAGYDPREASRFWRRFAQVGGEKPPEFMSTHPSDERRAADLEAMLPEAMADYNRAPEQYALGEPIITGGSRPGGPETRLANPAATLRPADATPAIQPAGGFPPSEHADPFLRPE